MARTGYGRSSAVLRSLSCRADVSRETQAAALSTADQAVDKFSHWKLSDPSQQSVIACIGEPHVHTWLARQSLSANAHAENRRPLGHRQRAASGSPPRTA